MLTEKIKGVIDKKIDFPMTRERYLATWKIFRSISDENYITAKHILSLDTWSNINSVLDLGCGDGLITKSLVLNSEDQVDRVTIIDPDKEMVDEAYMHLKEIGIVPYLTKECAKFEECLEKYVSDADVILGVHLVYLISPESFEYLIETIPVGKKLIIVLDDDDSVFTKLWQNTAPKYAERSKNVRSRMQSLSSTFNIKKSVITSRLINPLRQRADIKSALLSLMSYSDYELMNENSKKFVEETVARVVSGRFIECTSACYEMIKIS